jgi:transcription elongation GreA/GreB family factor
VARIAELEDKLARAELIDVSKSSGDTVKFGATVTLIDEDTGEKRYGRSSASRRQTPKRARFRFPRRWRVHSSAK